MLLIHQSQQFKFEVHLKSAPINDHDISTADVHNERNIFINFTLRESK